MTPQIKMTRVDGSEPNYHGEYKGHQIHASRANRNEDWYIWVRTPQGSLAYDGWWKDSARKSIHAAALEAIRGAMI